jgi:hypothetical protein
MASFSQEQALAWQIFRKPDLRAEVEAALDAAINEMLKGGNRVLQTTFRGNTSQIQYDKPASELVALITGALIILDGDATQIVSGDFSQFNI